MPTCGHVTKNGSECKRKVNTEGDRCHQHTQCSICYTGLTANNRTLPCRHRFHTECIDRWKTQGRNTCPICREPFDVPEFTVKITIEPRGGIPITSNLSTTSLLSIIDRLDLELRDLENNMTELHFNLENEEELEALLNDIGVASTVLTGLSRTARAHTE